METLEQSQCPTLAQRLGEAVHMSSLWRKVLQISHCPEDRVGEWLLKCAICRGARHYERDFPHDLPPDHPGLKDEEIAIALCLGQHPYNPTYIRAAAQLLSSPLTDAPSLVRLALEENAELVLSYVAHLAARFAPDLPPWPYLLEHLPGRLDCPPEALPHWSRFVSQTGVTAFGGGPEIKWLARSRTKR